VSAISHENKQLDGFVPQELMFIRVSTYRLSRNLRSLETAIDALGFVPSRHSPLYFSRIVATAVAEPQRLSTASFLSLLKKPMADFQFLRKLRLIGLKTRISLILGRNRCAQ
jgi:hypothetical protein